MSHVSTPPGYIETGSGMKLREGFYPMLGSRVCCSWNVSNANMAAWICSGAWWDGFKKMCLGVSQRVGSLCCVETFTSGLLRSGVRTWGSHSCLSRVSWNAPAGRYSDTNTKKIHVFFFNNASHLAPRRQTANLQICTSLGFSWGQQILRVRNVAARTCRLLQNCAERGLLIAHTHSNKTQHRYTQTEMSSIRRTPLRNAWRLQNVINTFTQNVYGQFFPSTPVMNICLPASQMKGKVSGI